MNLVCQYTQFTQIPQISTHDPIRLYRTESIVCVHTKFRDWCDYAVHGTAQCRYVPNILYYTACLVHITPIPTAPRCQRKFPPEPGLITELRGAFAARVACASTTVTRVVHRRAVLSPDDLLGLLTNISHVIGLRNTVRTHQKTIRHTNHQPPTTLPRNEQ